MEDKTISGGRFDYKQYAIDDIADRIEDYIYGHEIDYYTVQGLIHDSHGDHDEATDYAIAHHHTMPNPYGYRFPTIQQLKRAVKCLRKAAVYAQRADWLLSGDDSEEKFMERVIADIKAVKQGREVDYSTTAQ